MHIVKVFRLTVIGAVVYLVVGLLLAILEVIYDFDADFDDRPREYFFTGKPLSEQIAIFLAMSTQWPLLVFDELTAIMEENSHKRSR